MPELPEVEVVRRGLEHRVVGRTLNRVEVTGARSVRRQPGGAAELRSRLEGRRITAARRRGKYLWLILDGDETVGRDCLHVHLGMSGQMLVVDRATPRAAHQHVTAELSDGRQLRYVDQRTFGGWTVVPLVSGRADVLVPALAAHVAPDPFEDGFDLCHVARELRHRDGELKRLLLDQQVVSGIGNIYADEALWRGGVHGRRRSGALTLSSLRCVLGHAREVMREARSAGGTSFDSAYVNVNGASGHFDRSLDAYGRTGEPCRRCDTAILREVHLGRGSHFCPVCQPAPRRRSTGASPSGSRIR